ncbi:uncharacterized protein LOC144702212 [Wolffia australiana]
MVRWKLWQKPPRASQAIWLELVVRDLRGLPREGVRDLSGSSAEVQVHWSSSGRKNAVEKTSTAKQPIQPDGSASWREGFHRRCKIELAADSLKSLSWIVDLELHVYGSMSDDNASFLAKTSLDISKYIFDGQDRILRIPMECLLGGHAAEALLTVSVRISPRRSSASVVPAMARSMSQPAFWRALSRNSAKGTILSEKKTDLE